MSRAIVELGDALYSVGPVLVLVLAGADDTPTFGDWPIYVLALAVQFAGDLAVSTARRGSGSARRRPHGSRARVGSYAADVLLAGSACS